MRKFVISIVIAVFQAIIVNIFCCKVGCGVPGWALIMFVLIQTNLIRLVYDKYLDDNSDIRTDDNMDYLKY